MKYWLTAKSKYAISSSRWRVGIREISGVKVLKEMVSLTVDLTYLWFHLTCRFSSSSIKLQHTLLYSAQILLFCVAFPDHSSWMSLVVPDSSGIIVSSCIILLLKPLMHIGIIYGRWQTIDTAESG